MLFHQTGGFQIGQSARKHFVTRALSAHEWTHYHKAMSDQHHLVNLDDFLNEKLGRLQVQLLDVRVDCLDKNFVIGCGQNDAREEIGYDAFEQRNILKPIRMNFGKCCKAN